MSASPPTTLLSLLPCIQARSTSRRGGAWRRPARVAGPVLALANEVVRELRQFGILGRGLAVVDFLDEGHGTLQTSPARAGTGHCSSQTSLATMATPEWRWGYRGRGRRGEW